MLGEIDGTFTVLIPDLIIESADVYECNAFLEEECFKIEVGEPGGDSTSGNGDTSTGIIDETFEVQN